MSDRKRETVDHWSFVEGVKNPLGRLADACLDAYEENGNPLLEEAANALRAIEKVDLTGCVNIEYPKPLPWHIDVTTGVPILVSKRSPVLRNGRGSPEVLLLDAIQRCMNTVHALQTKQA